MRFYSVFFLLIIFLFTGACQSDGDQNITERRKSPIAIAKATYGDSYIKIVYGQPYKRGRSIFGDLVPYDEVWRTGANEATELTATRDVQFAGNQLDAGTYALFTIPREDEWTVILNSQLGQWGAFEYDASYDVMRVDVPARTTEDVAEAFTIQFTEVEEDSTSILMRWDQTEVRIPVTFLEDTSAS